MKNLVAPFRTSFFASIISASSLSYGWFDVNRASSEVSRVLSSYSGPGAEEARQEFLSAESVLTEASPGHLELVAGRFIALLDKNYRLFRLTVSPSLESITGLAVYSHSDLQAQALALSRRVAPTGRIVDGVNARGQGGEKILRFEASYRYHANNAAVTGPFGAVALDAVTGEIRSVTILGPSTKIDPARAIHRFPMEALSETAISLHNSISPYASSTYTTQLTLLCPSSSFDRMLNEMTPAHIEARNSRTLLPFLVVTFTATDVEERQTVYVDALTNRPMAWVRMSTVSFSKSSTAKPNRDAAGTWRTTSGSLVSLKRVGRSTITFGKGLEKRLYSNGRVLRMVFSSDLTLGQGPDGSLYHAKWTKNAAPPLKSYKDFGKR